MKNTARINERYNVIIPDTFITNNYLSIKLSFYHFLETSIVLHFALLQYCPNFKNRKKYRRLDSIFHVVKITKKKFFRRSFRSVG